MTSNLLCTAAALLLGSASLLSHAAVVNLSAWAHGQGHNVKVNSPGHTGLAGGFKGSVKFAAGGDGKGESGFSVALNDFITYCVEIEESFRLPSGDMGDYSVVAGASHAKWYNANKSGNTASGTANRLGQLLSYIGSDNTLVNSSAKSTSLQLAIWNVIYDNDADLDGGLFKSTKNDASAYNPYANKLLLDSANHAKTLDVFVLAKSGSQDFLLTRDISHTITTPSSQVPEPASLTLSLLALAAAGATLRRRRA